MSSNIREYGGTKHRHHFAAIALQKQRQNDKQKIKLALERFGKEAKAALNYLGVACVKNKNCDSISSITAKRPPMILNVRPMSPFSDVTNQNYLIDSFDETIRALISKKQTRVAANCNMDHGKIKIVHTKNDSIISTKPSLLSPRRYWELEPLQNALKRFALVQNTFQPFTTRFISEKGDNNTMFSSITQVDTNIIRGANPIFARGTAKTHAPICSVSEFSLQQYAQTDGEIQEIANDNAYEQDVSANTASTSISPVDDGKTEYLTIENNYSDYGLTTDDKKVYTFQENSNGATWIITNNSDKNKQNESLEGSITALNMSSESENYETSFDSED